MKINCWKDAQHYTSLGNWKLMRYHHTPKRMAKIQPFTIFRWGHGVIGTLFLAGGVQNGTATLEIRMAVSQKLNILLPIVSSTDSLDIYTNKLKTCIYTKTCTWIFITALFKMTKTQKQRCFLIGKWVDKIWYDHMVKYYSEIK